jgi:hypothetical protein
MRPEGETLAMIFDDWAIPDHAAPQQTWVERLFSELGAVHDGVGPVFGGSDNDFHGGDVLGLDHALQGAGGVFAANDDGPAGETALPGDVATPAAGGAGQRPATVDEAIARALPFMVADTPFAVGGQPSYSMKLLFDGHERGSSLGRLTGWF